MSRKTRKQKVRADRRRRFIGVIQKNAQPAQKEKTPTKTVPATKSNEPSGYETQIARFTIRDLRKTIIITILIFVLEFFVFYVNLKGV